MKEVIISSDETKIDELLDSARHGEVVLKTADGSEFLLRVMDDFDREIILTRQNAELMALLDERRKEKATIPWEQVKRELGLE